MDTKEHITRELQHLSAEELEQVAHYLTFVKYQSQLKTRTTRDEAQLAALYAEFAAEDHQLAEAGLSDYTAALAKEDA